MPLTSGVGLSSAMVGVWGRCLPEVRASARDVGGRVRPGDAGRRRAGTLDFACLPSYQNPDAIYVSGDYLVGHDINHV